MSRVSHRVAVVVICSTVLACATSGSGPSMSDAGVTSKVKSRLAADPEINPFRIDVDTMDGVVTLSGTVRTEHQRAEAARLAAGTTGVVKVVNDIQVGDKAFSETMDDAWIVTKISTKFAADPEINPFRIDVDCDRGVVTLRGTVRRATQKVEAERLATSTKGVRKVRNLIKVE